LDEIVALPMCFVVWVGDYFSRHGALPGPAPSPREVAERRQPPVTRREIVAAAAPEAAAQPPARMMPATAESVSRIGKLTPRRRAQLVFGLRRR